jgi:hypothetical protein
MESHMKKKPETKRRARVTKSREVRVHGELWHTSRILLKHGKERPEGSTHQFRASLVFTAFALEAYLNWLGHTQVPNWKYLERLNPREKTEVVAGKLGVALDFGTRPWSIVKPLFGFRNDIAHGKPKLLESDTIEAFDENLDAKLGEFLRTEWEEFCTEQNAVRAREDVAAIAELLHCAATFESVESTDPFSTGFQLHGASLE